MSNEETLPNIDDIPLDEEPSPAKPPVGFENITTAVQLLGKVLFPSTIPHVSYEILPPDYTDLPEMTSPWSLEVKLLCQDLMGGTSVEVSRRKWLVQADTETGVLHKAYEAVISELSLMICAREHEIAGIRNALAILQHPMAPTSMWNTSDPPEADGSVEAPAPPPVDVEACGITAQELESLTADVARLRQT